MADAPSFCYPAFHTRFAPMVGGTLDTPIASGCRPNANGDIPCTPEAMRAVAEKRLRQVGAWPAKKVLPLTTYTLGRYIHSEVGSGTVEERVAVGEAAVNQARRRGQDVNGLLLFTQPSRRYGEINVESGINTGRWASTSRDPSPLSLLLADLILTGQSGNFALGAVDQDGLEFQRFFPEPMNRHRQYAKSGNYWVGPLAGVDHWRTTLFKPFGFSSSSLQGQLLLAQAQRFFGSPTYQDGRVSQSLRPFWPSNLPICVGVTSTASSDTGRNTVLGLLAVGGLAVVGIGAWRIAKHLTHITPVLGE